MVGPAQAQSVAGRAGGARGPLLGLLAGVALSSLVLLGGLASRGDGQEKPAAAPVARWEYKVLSWRNQDTAEVFRRVTGATELADPDELARDLGRTLEPGDDPRVLAEIDRRTGLRLSEAGKEGWEAFWVQERPVIVGGFTIPVPTVFLKRTAR